MLKIGINFATLLYEVIDWRPLPFLHPWTGTIKSKRRTCMRQMCSNYYKCWTITSTTGRISALRKTWISLISSVPPSLNRTKESPSESAALWRPEAWISLRISDSVDRSVVTDHWTLAGIAAADWRWRPDKLCLKVLPLAHKTSLLVVYGYYGRWPF